MNFRAQQRAAIAIRWPHPARRFRSGGRSNRVLAAPEFAANSFRRLPNQVGVRIRVIANQVAPRVNFLCERRASAREFSNQEKCSTHRVPLEQFKQLRRNRRIWTVIKRERDFPRGSRVPQRRPKQLRGGNDRATRGDSRSSSCRATRCNCRKMIQFFSKLLFSHGIASLATRGVTICHKIQSKVRSNRIRLEAAFCSPCDKWNRPYHKAVSSW